MQRSRQVRKIPQRKIPHNKALNELVTSASALVDLVDDIEVPQIRDARRRLEHALGPFIRIANELG